MENLVSIDFEDSLTQNRRARDETVDGIIEKTERVAERYQKERNRVREARLVEAFSVKEKMSLDDKELLSEIAGYYLRNKFIPRSWMISLRQMIQRYQEG